MRQLADGLYQLSGFPPNAINVYLAGDVLIDAATKMARRRIERQLAGRELAAHALTHAHPDHQGSSHAICERRRIPLWCGEGDVEVVQNPDALSSPKAPAWLHAVEMRLWTGPAHTVDRVLREGDAVAGFTVLQTPGHSPGHLSYWRESDRTLILGDVFFNINPLTGRAALHEPPPMFTPDPTANRASARRMAALRPNLVCFGHGPPLRDPDALQAFVETLPA